MERGELSPEVAIAIQKQIPIKPNDETYFTNYGWQKRCPRCSDWVIVRDDMGELKMNYCCNCGQRILWEEE